MFKDLNKMSKHLENSEFDVQRDLMYLKGSRKEEKLWNDGDFEHNVEVVTAGNIQKNIPK